MQSWGVSTADKTAIGLQRWAQTSRGQPKPFHLDKLVCGVVRVMYAGC